MRRVDGGFGRRLLVVGVLEVRGGAGGVERVLM